MLEHWKKILTGGTRSVASGHDKAWPSKGLYSPSFHRSTIPVKLQPTYFSGSYCMADERRRVQNSLKLLWKTVMSTVPNTVSMAVE